MGHLALDLARLQASALASTPWAPIMAGRGMLHPLTMGPGTGHPAQART